MPLSAPTPSGMRPRALSAAELNKMSKAELLKTFQQYMSESEDVEKEATLLSTINDKLDRMNDTLKELDGIKQDMQTLKNDIHSLRNDMAMLRDENAKALGERNAMKEEIKAMHGIILSQQRFLEKIDYENRGRNLIVTGLSETTPLKVDDLSADSDAERVKIIFQAIGCGTEEPVDIVRIGKGELGNRPLKITVNSIKRRNEIIANSSSLKDKPSLSKIFLRRDTHPAIRTEWRRLTKAFKDEKNKPENSGCNIIFDKKEKVITRDGVVIDKWNPPLFA